MGKLESFFKKQDFGLLVLRVGIGALYMAFGIPKILGGAQKMEMIGKAISVLGISIWPLFWGFMAALSEALGGLLLILGYKTRVAAFLLFCTMGVATAYKYQGGNDLMNYAWPLQMTLLFFAMMFVGPGKFSIDKG